MIEIGVKILLLSLTVCCEFLDDFSSDKTLETTPAMTGTMTETDPSFEKIIIRSSTESISLYREVRRQFNYDLTILQKEAESCKKNYPKLSDPMYKLRMYRFLLNKLTEETERELLFNCDINTELVDSARKKLKLLESFQKSFVQDPKNSSTESPKRQTNPPDELENETNVEFLEGEDELRLKEEEEWKANVAHVSHIYLGRSMYPMITEESRVIENYPRSQEVRASTPGSSVRPTHTTDLYTVEKVYELLSPNRWNKDSKTRHRRDLQETLNQIRERFRQFWYQSKEKLRGTFFKKEEPTTAENATTEHVLEQNEENDY